MDPLTILIQVPIVGAFIWFSLAINARHAELIGRIMIDNRAANQAVMLDWRGYLKDRDDQWRGFLVEQRTAQNDTLDAYAETLAGLTKAISDLDRHVRTNGNGKAAQS